MAAISKVQQTRLMETLHRTCQWGAKYPWGSEPTETGMRRLALDDDDRKAREWFRETCLSLGCREVKVDEMGNMFAIRPGENEGPPTAMGSHLDTQPHGGRYDGILGIMAGIEALRALNDANIRTRYPVSVVNWTNEEGARFPQSIIASSVWSGDVTLQDAWSLRELEAFAVGGDAARRTMREELERIGFLGETKCHWQLGVPLAAHFELHIEQGPVLEAKDKAVAVVLGGQAYKWRTMDIIGRDAHTGSTPFEGRADALQCAAKVLVESKQVALRHGGLCTTGVLSVQPSSTNTIPGRVSMTLDMRHRSDDSLEALDAEVLERARRIAEAEGGCKVEVSLDSHVKAVQFHPDCIDAAARAAIKVVGPQGYEELRSGAGHDSFATSKRCPTAMIFARSREGVSHHPREYTSPEDCAKGAAVLLGAVLEYDARRQA